MKVPLVVIHRAAKRGVSEDQGLIQEPALLSPVPMKTSAFGSMTGAGTISIVAGCDIAMGRAGIVAACGIATEVAGMNGLIVTTEPNTVRIVVIVTRFRFVIEASWSYWPDTDSDACDRMLGAPCCVLISDGWDMISLERAQLLESRSGKLLRPMNRM
jgi:hypothetical protein